MTYTPPPSMPEEADAKPAARHADTLSRYATGLPPRAPARPGEAGAHPLEDWLRPRTRSGVQREWTGFLPLPRRRSDTTVPESPPHRLTRRTKTLPAMTEAPVQRARVGGEPKDWDVC